MWVCMCAHMHVESKVDVGYCPQELFHLTHEGTQSLQMWLV